MQLVGAHGDDIVRTVSVDSQVSNRDHVALITEIPTLMMAVGYNLHRRRRWGRQSLEAGRVSGQFFSVWSHKNEAKTR